jgi:hypothetical protein
MRGFMLSLVFVAAAATAASAADCRSFQVVIDKQFGKRFDKTASETRRLAKEGEKLCKAGKEADATKKYQEAAKAGGIQLTEQK